MRSIGYKIRVSNKVIEKSFAKFSRLGVFWTGGKDSTVLLDLIRRFKGKLDLPVFFIDHRMHFKETLNFVEKVRSLWNLNLVFLPMSKNILVNFEGLSLQEKKEAVRILKIRCIQEALKKFSLQGIFVGIRWDEHKERAKERFFSKREKHVRIHPILHFSELDIWEYIRQFDTPYNPLYDKGYRSIGERDFTKPVLDPRFPERAGREKEKELIMGKLRKMGYF